MFKELIKKAVLREKYNSESYVAWLQKKGVNIATSAYIVAPNKTLIDLSRPYLINIGQCVTITEGCKILTHGFDWSVLKIKYGDVLGSAGKVVIQDNCFIGVNAIILKGVTIGKNSIIGAGSVVCSDIPPNSVAAGNPCKVISSLGDYYEKRRLKQTDEAKMLIQEYYKKYQCLPPKSELAEFFWAFENHGEKVDHIFSSKMNYGGSLAMNTMKRYAETTSEYESYEQICENAIGEMKQSGTEG